MIKSADGVTGFILYSSFTKNVVFRVYDERHNFIDYDIHHSDLQVTISDSDAFFYYKNDKFILDHSPATLGINQD